MKNYIFIYWTQKRFLDDLPVYWLNRETAAVFLYYPDKLWWDIEFTLAVAIYHWISLQVQNIIIKHWYKTFSDFYWKFPGYLPVIALFSREIWWLEELSFSTYKSTSSHFTTYPYYKIKELWKLDTMVDVLEISMNNVISSEQFLWQHIKSSNDRFFTKVWDKSRFNASRSSLVDKEQMFTFCMDLSKSIVQDVMSVCEDAL